jgi:hypothetical protein
MNFCLTEPAPTKLPLNSLLIVVVIHWFTVHAAQRHVGGLLREMFGIVTFPMLHFEYVPP